MINQGRAVHDDRPSGHRDRGDLPRRQPPARQRPPRSDRGVRRLLGDPAGDRARQQPELAALRLLRPQSPSAGPAGSIAATAAARPTAQAHLYARNISLLLADYADPSVGGCRRQLAGGRMAARDRDLQRRRVRRRRRHQSARRLRQRRRPSPRRGAAAPGVWAFPTTGPIVPCVGRRRLRPVGRHHRRAVSERRQRRAGRRRRLSRATTRMWSNAR